MDAQLEKPPETPILSVFTLPQLRDQMQKQTDAISKAKENQQVILAEVARRYTHQLSTEFDSKDKPSGEVTQEFDGVKLSYKIGKKVEWDNGKLMEIAATLPYETTQKVFDIEFSIPEARFKNIDMLPKELSDRIVEARTVKYSEPKIEIK